MPRKLPTSLLAAALAFAVLVLADAPAYAAFPTAQFTATAQVNANCTVTESGTLTFQWVGDNGYSVTEIAPIRVE